ncbi:MAG: hypothetical protein LUH14_09600 [Clostridiaceae bacterium]|nr:hypothetical protein [Clostridiaceae bacterium]
MRSFLDRIFCDKIKLTIILILILLPTADVFIILFQSKTEILPYALYATFLSGYSKGHILQSLYLWFVPLYFLLITGDNCIEDYQTGYKSILVSKIGKASMIRKNLCISFMLPFLILVVGLTLNLIAAMIAFRNGAYSPMGGEYAVYDALNMPETLLFKLSYTHPLSANLIYILAAAFLSGLISMVGTSFSLILHERKFVYSITFALWLGPLLMKNSSMLLFQPFSEYGFNVLMPIFLWITAIYVAIITAVNIWEVKFCEI